MESTGHTEKGGGSQIALK